MSEHSAACCSVPPVVSEGYNPKGTYESVGGIKCYTSGPSNADKALLVVYDIFGYFPQTIQGADILGQQYRVFMPDFFLGSPADISWYPPDTEEKGKKLGAFFQNEAVPQKALEKVPGILSDAQSKNPSIKTWGVVGYCWGGKIVSLLSAGDSMFKAGAECHPAMVDPNDATKISIPICMLPSKDEDADAVKAFGNNLGNKASKVETFDDQIHGWMAARGDLLDSRVKEQYEKGYQILLNFFHNTLNGSATSKI